MTTPVQSVVDEVIKSRYSCRAFLPELVSQDVVAEILSIASHAPSGTNIQPWRVRVLMGAARQRLVDAVLSFRAIHPGVEHWGYSYYPAQWQEPYLGRRRKVGWDLYGLLGINRSDTDRIRAQHNRNFMFFDAPVGLIFTIETELERGSWLDYGMFLQSVTLAAEAEGLGTCLQACWVAHADVVSNTLSFAPNEQIVCGLALGYPDQDSSVNRLITERAPVDEFVTFVDE